MVRRLVATLTAPDFGDPPARDGPRSTLRSKRLTGTGA